MKIELELVSTKGKCFKFHVRQPKKLKWKHSHPKSCSIQQNNTSITNKKTKTFNTRSLIVNIHVLKMTILTRLICSHLPTILETWSNTLLSTIIEKCLHLEINSMKLCSNFVSNEISKTCLFWRNNYANFLWKELYKRWIQKMGWPHRFWYTIESSKADSKSNFKA